MEQEVILASDIWINAGGFALITVGVIVLILELILPSYGLFGFTGASVLVIGIVQLHQTGYIEELPVSKQALSMAVGIGLVLAFFGAKHTLRLYKKRNTTGVEAMIGQEAWVILWRGNKGRIQIQGEDWRAYSDESRSLKRGEKVIISKVEDLKIKISYLDSAH